MVPASRRFFTLICATTSTPSLANSFVPAGVVAVIMRVDQIFDRQVGDGGDRRLDLVVQRRVLAVDHDDARLGDGDRDVSTLALQHVDVVAEVGGLDLDLGEIGRRRRGRGGWLLLRACRCRPGDRTVAAAANTLANHQSPPGPVLPNP